MMDSIMVNMESIHVAAANLARLKHQKKNGVELRENELAIAEERLRVAQESTLQTYLHELGHAIAFNTVQERFLDWSVRGKEISQQDKMVMTGLMRDYYKFLERNLNGTTSQVLPKLFSLPRAFDQATRWGEVTAATDRRDLLARIRGSELMQNGFIRAATGVGNMGQKYAEYAFSFREYLAEEFSKVALGNDRYLLGLEKTPLLKDIVKDIRKAMEVAKGEFGSTTPTLTNFFRRISLQEQLREHGKDLAKNVEQNPFAGIAKDQILADGELDFGKLGEEYDRFNWFMDKGFTILQIAEQNPHVRGLQSYVDNLRDWKNEVNNNLAIAETRLQEWKSLPKDQMESLGRSLYDETIGRLPDGGWLKDPRFFTPEELAKYKLSDEALALRKKIKEDFRNTLQEMEAVLIQAKKQIFADDLQKQTAEIRDVKAEFTKMLSRPYFPLMRFGEYTVQVRANGDQVYDGRNYKDGELIEFQAFDTKRERDKAFSEFNRQPGRTSLNISRSKMIDPNFSLQGMPLTLIEHLEQKLTSVQLDEKTQEALRQVKNDVLPFKSFRKQFQKRKNVAGFSLDAMRSYANYMTSFSNHIARVKFDRKFKQDFDNVEASVKLINLKNNADSTKRASMLNHMNDHLNYVMSPVNEFVGLRSAAFFWYLGFNVKSAFVNLTQIPLVTYPYLAARFGDGRAVAQLGRAYKAATQAIKNPDNLDGELKELIEKGISESWLDESLATELALAASEKNLDKSLPRAFRQKAAMKISHYGSLPFHVAEKLNRHVAAIAAFRLAKADGKSKEQAFGAAREAVEKTQYEYARWARPKFMRGKLGGTVFVFQSYLQNTLYFALGGDPRSLAYADHAVPCRWSTRHSVRREYYGFG